MPWIRARLLELVEEKADSGYELLYAVSRLVKIGPPGVLAPRLKVVCNSIEEPKIQVVMQCLLWRWY